MMFRRKTLSAVVVAAAIALVISGCGSSSKGGTPATSTTLTLGVLFPATTFAAQDMNFANESPYGQAVYDNLLRADPSGKVIPSLATDWKYNADKTELDMTLRSDVTFTDGTKFNADAAAQNLKRFRDGASPNKSFLVNLKDAKAVDDTHLEITLTTSDPGFLNYLTQNAGMIEAPSAFGKPDIKTNPVGSGPYILDTGATVVGSSYSFTKNPNYWNKADQHYEKLVLKVFGDPTAMLNAIKGGQLNGATVNNDVLDQVKSAGYTLYPTDGGGWAGLNLVDRAGTVNPALKEVKVRQAINYSFDRASLLAAVGKGHGTATAQVFPPTSAGYDPSLDSAYAYDAAKAKSLLAEAGFPNGFSLDLPSTSLIPPATFTILAQQLKDIGITVNVTDAGNNFIPDVLSAKYAAIWMPLQQDPDWQLINFLITPTATFNPFKSTDPKVEDLVKKYHDAASDAESTSAVKDLNKYLVDQAWFAPWYRIELNYATDSKTSVIQQVGNAYPYLWNFVPKS
jgi:peptide/nickel transport system substrate-binding protein